jgi:peptidoglycan/xylan/chitin deacetylase (PgdA/CDA1 family)
MSVAAAPGLINLTFHGVGPRTRELDGGEDQYWLSREMFISMLDTVAAHPHVALTFDDGNASDLHIALPALRERGLSATFFVVAGRLGTPGFLCSDEVRALADAGMTIGSHGMHHRRWRNLARRDLDEELGASRRRLERLAGGPVTRAAIPFGAYDRGVLQALRRHGYDRAFTSDRGPAHPDRWLQARNSLSKHDRPDELQRMLWQHAPAWTEAARRTKLLVKRWR